MPLTRLNKYLSENGYCSRREADRLIQAGRVFVNGKQASLGDKVSEEDEVRVEGRDKRRPPEKIYLMLNKPIGVTDAVDFVHFPEKIFAVGRLEQQVEGLVFLTNDQVLANRLTRPGRTYEQEYVVEVDRRLDMKHIRQWQTLPAKVRKIDDFRFAIILDGGDYKRIRQLCEALDYQVVRLKRTRILSLKLPARYPDGNWRHLTESEIRSLRNDLGMDKNPARW